MYFFGSVERFATSVGHRRARRRPDWNRRWQLGDAREPYPSGLSIVPRNDFVGKPIHRVYLRVQRRFALGHGVNVDGIVEVFNAFNHKNFGAYVSN